MRHLKYLIFIIISLFSVETFAYYYTIESSLPGISGKQFPSPVSACQYYADFMGYTYISVTQDGRGSYKYNCNTKNKQNYDAVNGIQELGQATKCPASGYPIPIYFTEGTPIPLRTCKQNPDGTFCITEWTGDKNKPVVISGNNYQSITHASVSEIPSPTCTPLYSQDTCNSKDPYGGCYKPPNDNCNRMSDGSIYCPPDEPPPPIKSGCQNGATYCDMPPTGCGTGYVPGTFNGKQICVKNSNPPPTDPIPQPPEPDPTDPPDPNDPPPASSPPPAIPPESSTILRSILDAINAVNNKLTWVKDEIVNSVNNVSRTLGITNQKLDAVNSSVKETTAAVKETTAAVNNVKAAVDANATTVKTAVEANTAATNGVKSAVEANTTSTANKLNDVVNAINNKPVGGGGTAVNLGPTNDLLKGIHDWLAVSDDTNPEDGEIKVVKNEIDTNFDGNLVNATGTCPQPMQISFSIVQTYTIQFSYETFCLGASLARPWIIFVGMLTAFFIVTGHYRGGSND
ncbi:methyl-accepting chemotaxis protein [Acinetobacter baumannii]|nr:methyl-accepting chemotaxis protein [Acinetobacter baumannii]EKU3412782.1 methyl-accepting chemotaxis protein [Acinetobacter baumannii]